MRLPLLPLIVALLGVTACALAVPASRPAVDAATASWTPHGEPTVTPDVLAGDIVTVSQVLADPSAFKDREITLTGRVSEVCTNKGCWVKLTPADAGESPRPAAGVDEASVFVKLTCGGDTFIVPLASKNGLAFARGTLVVQDYSEADARHIAQDGGATPEEAAKIVGPRTTLRLMTPGLHVAHVAAG